ncbi:heme exporter protein CcmD [Aquimixticola soesokkakensis]
MSILPDLGKYAGAVLMAYGVSFALLALLVAQSVIRAARMKTRLRAAEARRSAVTESLPDA